MAIVMIRSRFPSAGAVFKGATALGLSALLMACASREPSAPPATAPEAPPACTPADPGDPLIGNWLSVSARQGVAGSLRTLFTLNADGSMSYVEQIKRPRTPSQGLQESGCWVHEGGTLTVRTLESNGLPVNLDDPIYTNRYQVQRAQADQLELRGPSGRVRAKRMSPGYRLPF